MSAVTNLLSQLAVVPLPAARGGTSVTTAAAELARINALAVPSTSYGSSSGYVKFANGLTLQWGTVVGSSSDTAVTFPLAFTTSAPFVVASVTAAAVSNTAFEGVEISSVTASGFAGRPRIVNGSSVAISGSAWSWHAVGNI